MIGYYVHHVGSGHLHRAQSIAAASPVPVVGLSSLPRPAKWSGDWVLLPRDDLGPADPDASAGGLLHWAPPHDAGLRARSAALSVWINRARPRLLVSDVSVEVALLARLHGVPVVSFALPGRRDDPAHLLGFGVSTALLAAWPGEVPRMLPGLPESLAARVHHVGGLSRFPVTSSVVGRRPGPFRVTVLSGRGGGSPPADILNGARSQTPAWEWTVLGGDPSHWRQDPFPVLCDADVVVCQAGQNSIADVAAARRPCVVVPADRPHDEQRTTADALAAGHWPVLVEADFPGTGWPERLERARGLDGRQWEAWCDGRAAERTAAVLRREHDRTAVGVPA